MIDLSEVKYEKAVLVGLVTNFQNEERSKEYLDELEFLATTAGAKVYGRITQKMTTQNPKTFIGAGKLEELRLFIDKNELDIAIFDDELSPAQLRNIERVIEVKILDRTNL
ncbi:MAG: GTPase HflX, partial [Flavobacteriales bacterium]|nr:GTPase HflX [Flavobacteriales bacterium]